MAVYRADEPCACFHGAEAGVSNLQGQDLGTGGNAIALRFLREVTCCNTCHMCPMSTFKRTQASQTGAYTALDICTDISFCHNLLHWTSFCVK